MQRPNTGKGVRNTRAKKKGVRRQGHGNREESPSGGEEGKGGPGEEGNQDQRPGRAQLGNWGRVLTLPKGEKELHFRRWDAQIGSEAPTMPITSASISAIFAKVLLMVASPGTDSSLYTSCLPSHTTPRVSHNHRRLRQRAGAVLPNSRQTTRETLATKRTA